MAPSKTGKLVNCFKCNKEIYRTKSQIERSKTEFFCSKSCEAEYKRVWPIIEINCECCGKSFKRSSGTINFYKEHKITEKSFCSMKCYREFYHVEKKIYICVVCNKEYVAKDYRQTRYCSKECSNQNRKSTERLDVKCNECGKDFKIFKSKIKSNKKGFFYCNPKCYQMFLNKRKLIIPQKKTYSKKVLHRRNFGQEQKILCKTVFRRDNYACRKCGEKYKGLNAHHIIPYRKAPHLLLELSNVITLCIPCHNEIRNKEMIVALDFIKIMLSDEFLLAGL